MLFKFINRIIKQALINTSSKVDSSLKEKADEIFLIPTQIDLIKILIKKYFKHNTETIITY